MIHVCYVLYDSDGRYSKWAGTSMLSMFENTSASPHSVIVHILHDNTLTAENRDKFSYVAGMYNQTVKFYNVSQYEELLDKFRKFTPKYIMEQYSIACAYLFLVPMLLPETIDKVIFSGSDLIYNLDVREFFDIDLGEAPMAAISEKQQGAEVEKFTLVRWGLVKPENYSNDGIFLMNVRKWREEFDLLLEGMEFVFNHPECYWYDQDIVNYTFRNRIQQLPMKFNFWVTRQRKIGETKIGKNIYHYLSKSLSLDMSDNFNRLWFKYFAKTPWFNEETIGHLYEGVKKIYIEQKDFSAQISALISGKTRAFFVSPENIESVKQIFHVKPEEEIIAADSPESLQRVANSLAARDRVFFILTGNYSAVAQHLTRAEFVEGRDFLNALLFLSDANGLPLNSYPLIKLL